mmetsp:Transcript_28173/g.71826  ORF Transcript_28173/g.71826 Transcript_28173/m.71826 type:complete len:208 (-) Transcript_28173:183-806(-)
MMKLSDEQLEQIKATGWTREVAFKTTPNVTKLEIKAYLEGVYGMAVERVQTINYLGRLRQLATQVPGSYKYGRLSRPKLYREDDWKKAYVTFAPPPGVQLDAPPKPASPADMLQALRSSRRGPVDSSRRVQRPDLLYPDQVLAEVREKQAAAAAEQQDKERKAGRADPSLEGGDGKAAPAITGGDAAAAPAEQAGASQPEPVGRKQA